MIADLFYPTFTLTITVLACFIRRKKLFEGSRPCLHQGIALYLLGEGGLQLPPDAQLQSFLALPITNAPIFLLYYPLISTHYHIFYENFFSSLPFY